MHRSCWSPFRESSATALETSAQRLCRAPRDATGNWFGGCGVTLQSGRRAFDHRRAIVVSERRPGGEGASRRDGRGSCQRRRYEGGDRPVAFPVPARGASSRHGRGTVPHALRLSRGDRCVRRRIVRRAGLRPGEICYSGRKARRSFTRPAMRNRRCSRASTPSRVSGCTGAFSLQQCWAAASASMSPLIWPADESRRCTDRRGGARTPMQAMPSGGMAAIHPQLPMRCGLRWAPLCRRSRS